MSKAQDLDYQPRPKVQETPEWNGVGFDLRVLIKDAKTGEVIRHQPYNRHCVGRHVYYERPVGSGNLFYGDGKPAGRWMKQENGEYGAQTDLPHVSAPEPIAPMSADAVAEENETLRRELAAAKAELEALTAPSKSEEKETQSKGRWS
jgi:hypothetical protein